MSDENPFGEAFEGMNFREIEKAIMEDVSEMIMKAPKARDQTYMSNLLLTLIRIQLLDYWVAREMRGELEMLEQLITRIEYYLAVELAPKASSPIRTAVEN